MHFQQNRFLMKIIKFDWKKKSFKEIQACVGSDFLPADMRELLEKGISSSIEDILIEHPYIDKDFRSTYYNDFSKRFSDIKRDSFRLHFFGNSKKKYFGFITLRDTYPVTIGRSYLSPLALKSFKKGYYLLSEFPVNLSEFIIPDFKHGKFIDSAEKISTPKTIIPDYKLTVKAFPWMRQDDNVSICAHVAMWEIIRYYSQRHKCYGEYTLQEIINLTEAEHHNRLVPSDGETTESISYAFKKIGFAPEVYYRKSNEVPEPVGLEDEFFEELIYIFIESGIPFIAATKDHAVSIIGHSEINMTLIEERIKEGENIISSHKLIDGYFSGNDNLLPYSEIPLEKNNKVPVCIKDIEGIVVPLYQKMYYDVRKLRQDIIKEIENQYIPKDKKFIRRIFITTSKSFKKFINDSEKDDIYKGLISISLMPKFIWVVEYSEINDYKDKKISYRFLFDTTALKRYNFNRILLSSKMGNVFFYPGGEHIYLSDEKGPIYTHNLKKVN